VAPETLKKWKVAITSVGQDWKNGTIWFTRCPGSCKMKHQDIKFKTRRIQATETKEQNNSKIGKEPDTTSLEDLLEYI